jgi:Family of unknown function (DUF6226)
VDLDTVRARVATAFAETGVATRAWPDPHPDRQPASDEYSRCSDPAKYRVVGARAQAWVRALTELGLATAAPAAEVQAAWRDGAPGPRDAGSVRAEWVRPVRTDAVPLLVCFRGFGGGTDNVVTLGAGSPAVEVATVPDCGCDACDSGSADLLEDFDEHVLDVVTGDFTHVTTRGGTAVGRRNGWSASGLSGPGLVQRLLDEARAGGSPHLVVRGARWW